MFLNAIFSPRAKENIDSSLLDLLSELDSTAVAPDVGAAAHHATLLDKRRLYARLCLATFEACGGEAYAGAIRAACALELAAAALFAHHDLPEHDDLALRFGTPVVHHAYSEGAAQQAGDKLLTDSFMALAAAKVDAPKLRTSMLYSLASALVFLYRNPGGHQIAYDTMKSTNKRGGYTATHLCEVAAVVGALAAGEKNTIGWWRFGNAMGEVYQLSDDIRDAFLPQPNKAHVYAHDKQIVSDRLSDALDISAVIGMMQTDTARVISLVPACIGREELMRVLGKAVHAGLPDQLWAEAV